MRYGKLNLNAARLEDLVAAGIDLHSANDIRHWRDTHGGFRSWAHVEGVPSVDRDLIVLLKEAFVLEEEDQPAAIP